MTNEKDILNELDESENSHTLNGERYYFYLDVKNALRSSRDQALSDVLELINERMKILGTKLKLMNETNNYTVPQWNRVISEQDCLKALIENIKALRSEASCASDSSDSEELGGKK